MAGKTGRTAAARDAWFIGFTADDVGGVWMGYDDNTPLTGVTGGGLPTEIWRETMIRVHEGVPVRPLPLLPPRGATRVTTEPPATTEGIIEGLLRDILGGGGGGTGARGSDPGGGER